MTYKSLLYRIILLLIVPSFAQAQTNTVIRGQLAQHGISDTVLLLLHAEYPISETKPDGADTTLTFITHDGEFTFQLPFLREIRPFSLYLNPTRQTFHRVLQAEDVLERYLLEPGDSLHIRLDAHRFTFSGKGSSKAVCIQALMEALQTVDSMRYLRDETAGNSIWAGTFRDPADGSFDLAEYGNYISIMKLATLFKYKNKISDDAYGLLKADIIGEANVLACQVMRPLLWSENPDKIRKGIHRYRISGLQTVTNIPAEVLTRSSIYADYLVLRAAIELRSKQLMNLPVPASMYALIEQQYTGRLREKLLLIQLYYDAQNTRVTDSMLRHLARVIKTPSYQKMIGEMTERFLVGKPVYNFSMQDKNGREVRLSDFRGKVVLTDMWFTGCSGCVAVAKGLPDVEAAFAGNKDVVFVSISIDNDKERWLQSIDPDRPMRPSSSYAYTHYTTPTTHYLYTGGKGADNEFIRRYVPHAYPHLLLIDKKGKVFAADPPAPTTQEGKAALIALIGKAANQ